MNLKSHVMLDLETLGTRAGCGIIAIGACTLDCSDTFYQKILPSSASEAGLFEDPDTMKWWAKQSPAAREESFSGTTPLISVLGSFADWLLQVKRSTNTMSEISVWGNGADFDQPILSAAYHAVKMKQPWKPYNGRCYRTLKNLKPQVAAPVFEGEKHTALADALHQARHAQLLLASLQVL